jgi:hypothetical protein
MKAQGGSQAGRILFYFNSLRMAAYRKNNPVPGRYLSAVVQAAVGHYINWATPALFNTPPSKEKVKFSRYRPEQALGDPVG